MSGVSGLGAVPVVPSGTQWTISYDDHEATVVEVGGGLRGYQVGGRDVLDGYGLDELCPYGSGQILAPWPNRIRDGRYTFGGEERQLALTEAARHNAIHGLVNWSRWQAAPSTHQGPARVAPSTDPGPAGRAAAAITVGYDLPPQPGYPWPVRFATTWSVGPDGLMGEHSATNLGSSPCPFGFSVHPYLAFPGTAVDELTLRVPARNRLLLDGRLLPIGAARIAGTEYDYNEGRRIGSAVLDISFGDVVHDEDQTSAVTLSTVEGRQTRIWADGGFGWWQVFTSDTLGGARHRRSVAVEPMTCPPDAFRSGRDLITLEPGQTWHGRWGITPSAGVAPSPGIAASPGAGASP